MCFQDPTSILPDCLLFKCLLTRLLSRSESRILADEAETQNRQVTQELGLSGLGCNYPPPRTPGAAAQHYNPLGKAGSNGRKLAYIRSPRPAYPIELDSPSRSRRRENSEDTSHHRLGDKVYHATIKKVVDGLTAMNVAEKNSHRKQREFGRILSCQYTILYLLRASSEPCFLFPRPATCAASTGAFRLGEADNQHVILGSVVGGRGFRMLRPMCCAWRPQ